MEKTIYLIDNMVICSRAIAPYLQHPIVTESAWVIDEVVYEARKSKQYEHIKKLQHHLEARDIEQLKTIAQACISEYKVLKLYEGCADALLLATALSINDSATQQTSLQLEAIKPIIVSEEKGIRSACDILGIEWLSQSSFIRILKEIPNHELRLSYTNAP